MSNSRPRGGGADGGRYADDWSDVGELAGWLAGDGPDVPRNALHKEEGAACAGVHQKDLAAIKVSCGDLVKDRGALQVGGALT